MVLILSRRLTRYSISPDKDECADKTDNCHSNARCDNIVGFFNCTCLQGFTGDGVTCSGMVDSLMVFSRGPSLFSIVGDKLILTYGTNTSLSFSNVFILRTPVWL